MPTQIEVARTHARQLHVAEDGFYAHLAVVRDAAPPVRLRLETPEALGNLAGSDIEALAFLVMMDATQNLDDDLKAIMGEVKAMTAAKQQLRESLVDHVKLPPCKHCVDIEAAIALMLAAYETEVDDVIREIDAMTEMSEMEKLRLQMAMDRLSKMMSTLSHLLKKISDTQQTIVQNLK